MINKLNEQFKALEEAFNIEDTKKPTEQDLDAIYNAIETLNKSEWFVNSKTEVDALHRAQKILQNIIDNARGLYED
jgi:hypothetical protein